MHPRFAVRAFLFAVLAAVMACGADATIPGAHSPIEGTFRLETVNGQPVPFLDGLESRPSRTFLTPPDSGYYASDTITFVATTDSSGSISRSQSWIYRYRPLRADTTTTFAGSGDWTDQGGVYVITYYGASSTVVLESGAAAFTIYYGANGLYPNGLTGRYVRIKP